MDLNLIESFSLIPTVKMLWPWFICERNGSVKHPVGEFCQGETKGASFLFKPENVLNLDAIAYMQKARRRTMGTY